MDCKTINTALKGNSLLGALTGNQTTTASMVLVHYFRAIGKTDFSTL